jgi:DMSO/TMAO reductase YedYZ molybdopterin-dependent catalytic subunit
MQTRSSNAARSSLAVLAALCVHYVAFYIVSTPLLTESAAEWIMARTPSRFAVPLLATLGAWAKPFAMTGALALLGAATLAAQIAWRGRRGYLPGLLTLAAAAAVLSLILGYASLPGALSFWLPAALALLLLNRPQSHALSTPPAPTRRLFLASTMTAGVAAVAGESYLRNAALARRAVQPVSLFPFTPPASPFGNGLVRPNVTPIPEFYGMSKNAVDPSLSPTTWRLRLTLEGQPLREFTFAELLTLPRTTRYATLRCISNTLRSDLMGTALWSGFPLSRLIDRRLLPADVLEAAVIGADGHSDSVAIDYAFSDEFLLITGMDGKTLSRIHGFPLRMLAPRYYGFKNVKWISEIRFVRQPFYGAWPKLGYTRQPLIHTASHIDRLRRSGNTLSLGGVSFAGIRGIRDVVLRSGAGPWQKATLEAPLSPYTWTRWYGELPLGNATTVEARALDGAGNWQESTAGPLFPNGVTGPTIRSLES